MFSLRPVALSAIFLLAACTGEEPGDEPTPENGMPTGASSWTGSLELNGHGFLVDADLTNDGGDISVDVVFTDDPDNNPSGVGGGSYRLTGTHEPTGGHIALAPDVWIDEPAITIELVGLTATYDPETDTMSGVMIDYASGADNALLGGPVSLTRESGDGEALVEGDGALGLSPGEHTLVGTMRCTGSDRYTRLDLNLDDEGWLTGTVTLGDPDEASLLGTFAVTGVHNPSTGGITLAPGVWEQPVDQPLTFFVDGKLDADGVFDGDVRTNIDACDADTWSVSLQ